MFSFDFFVSWWMNMFILLLSSIHHKCKKGREGLPFDWFDWIEFALTWQVSEQDETYRKKGERERTRNRSAICQHQSSPVVIELDLYRANNARSSSSPGSRSFITEEEGTGLHKLTFIVLFDIHQNLNVFWSILFLFIFLFFTLLPRWVSTEQ
jgi:hypothetical protein